MTVWTVEGDSVFKNNIIKDCLRIIVQATIYILRNTHLSRKEILVGRVESGVFSPRSLLGLSMRSPVLKQKQGIAALLGFPREPKV